MTTTKSTATSTPTTATLTAAEAFVQACRAGGYQARIVTTAEFPEFTERPGARRTDAGDEYVHTYDDEPCDLPGDRADDEHICGHGFGVRLA
jgi:hypothetical protein